MAAVKQKILKELQRTAALSALDTLYEGPKMNLADLKAKVYQHFHGDERNASSAPYAKLICEGRQQFAGLFDRLPRNTSITYTSNGAAREMPPLLRLKPIFTQLPHVSYSMGIDTSNDFHLLSMQRKFPNSPAKISDNTLYRQATSSLRNIKKAVAIANEYLIEGTLPSGKNNDDWCEHVLSEMYKQQHTLLTNTMLLDDDDEEEDVSPDDAPPDDDAPGEEEIHDESKINHSDSNTTQQHPPGWFFEGWFAFLLWGPMAAKEEQSSLLQVGDYFIARGPKGNGRKAARAVRAAERSADRSRGAVACLQADPTGQGGIRGLSVEQQLRFVSVIQCQNNAVERQKENTAFLLAQQMNDLRQDINHTFEFARMVCPEFDEENFAWKDYLHAKEDCSRKRKALEELQSTGDKPFNQQDPFLTSFISHQQQKQGDNYLSDDSTS